MGLVGLVISAAAFGQAYLIENDSRFAPKLPHHYGIMSIGSIVAFAVVFRTNLGWQRYWEAMTQQHFMYSKWADAFSQFYAFAQVTLTGAEAKTGQEAYAKIQR